MLLVFVHRCAVQQLLHIPKIEYNIYKKRDKPVEALLRKRIPGILHKQFVAGDFLKAAQVEENCINTTGVIKNNQNGNIIVTLCCLVGAGGEDSSSGGGFSTFFHYFSPH